MHALTKGIDAKLTGVGLMGLSSINFLPPARRFNAEAAGDSNACSAMDVVFMFTSRSFDDYVDVYWFSWLFLLR
jgi:hypothetical protein